MKTSSGPIRALIAVGAGGTAVVLSHDSPWLESDIENVNDHCDDIGIESPDGVGLWLWEGSGKLVSQNGLDGMDPPSPEYTGRCRRVEPHELAELLAMEAPETCVVCGEPATDHYPDADGEPSCGRAECEIRMQAAIDYHDDRG